MAVQASTTPQVVISDVTHHFQVLRLVGGVVAQWDWETIGMVIPTTFEEARVIGVFMVPFTNTATAIALDREQSFALFRHLRETVVLDQDLARLIETNIASDAATPSGFVSSKLTSFNQRVFPGDEITLTMPPLDGNATPTARFYLYTHLRIIKW